MKPWNDTNRFNQTGYSAPTIFPQFMHYDNPDLWAEDMVKATRREESHQEWLADERQEARENEYWERQEREEED